MNTHFFRTYSKWRN